MNKATLDGVKAAIETLSCVLDASTDEIIDALAAGSLLSEKESAQIKWSIKG